MVNALLDIIEEENKTETDSQLQSNEELPTVADI